MIGQLLGFETIEMGSPLSEHECLQRLRDSIGSDWSLLPSHDILGAVGAHSFRLSVRQGALKRNMFQTFVYGKTMAAGSSTKIVCRFGMQRLAAAIGGILLVAGLTATGVEAVSDLMKAQSLSDVLSAMLFPIIFLIFVAAAIFFGRVLAQDEPFILLKFLRDTIEARETSPTT
jgi:hypothetical protein